MNFSLAEAVVNSPELMILLKSSLVIAFALIFVLAMSSARASVRHLSLTCAFAILLIFPLVTLIAPSFRLKLADSEPTNPIAANPNQAQISNTAMVTSPDSVSTKTGVNSKWFTSLTLRNSLLLAWVLGFSLLLVRLVTRLMQLRTTRRSGIPSLEISEQMQVIATESRVSRQPEVLLNNAVEVPFTYGFLNPVVLLPAEAWTWTEADLQRVLVHEMEHIKRGDWLVQMMAEAVCAIYWFQPLMWIGLRRLCLEAERSCDDAVVVRTDSTDYAEQLINLARRLSNRLPSPVLSMANRSDLSMRVSSILDNDQTRGRAGFRWTAMALMVSSALVLCIAPGLAFDRVQAQSQEIRVKSTTDTKSKALNRALVESAESGSIKEVEELINAGADINGIVDGDGTALIVAAREGNQPLVELLLKLGGDVNLAAPGDGNPLIMAAREGHVKIVQLLLDRGASIDQIVEGDENALIQASASGEIVVVKLLVSRGADVNARAWSGGSKGEWRTALMLARRNGHNAVVEFLMANGARE